MPDINKSRSGLYIHIPFCRSKCSYCSFYSTPDRSLVPEFTDALIREIKTRPGGLGEFDTVYFGGGTPTVLGLGPIKEIVKAIHENFEVIADNEWTIEANPTGLDPAFLSELRALGFNRINIGVQSFNDGILRFLGRLHDSGRARQAVNDARSAGFQNIGLDLIYGVPGQDMSCWMESLTEAAALSPEHLSCYQLSIEPETPLGKLLSEGKISLPGEDLQYDFFMQTSGFLESSGYVHYEISNYSRGPELAARHNSKYWEHTPYLGLGPSAHSFSGTRRWWNISDVRKYTDLLNCGESPVEGSEEIGAAEICLEMLGLGLRTRKGLSLKDLEAARGRPLDKKDYEFLDVFRNEGYFDVEGGFLRPTLKGMAVADRLAVELSILSDC
jgi:oxygen-independent coproporphyrinogen-3 oxidase